MYIFLKPSHRGEYEPTDSEEVSKRVPYSFGIGKKSEPYMVRKRIGSPQPWETQDFGKRAPYGFGIGKRAPYNFGIGK